MSDNLAGTTIEIKQLKQKEKKLELAILRNKRKIRLYKNKTTLSVEDSDDLAKLERKVNGQIRMMDTVSNQMKKLKKHYDHIKTHNTSSLVKIVLHTKVPGYERVIYKSSMSIPNVRNKNEFPYLHNTIKFNPTCITEYPEYEDKVIAQFNSRKEKYASNTIFRESIFFTQSGMDTLRSKSFCSTELLSMPIQGDIETMKMEIAEANLNMLVKTLFKNKKILYLRGNGNDPYIILDAQYKYPLKYHPVYGEYFAMRKTLYNLIGEVMGMIHRLGINVDPEIRQEKTDKYKMSDYILGSLEEEIQKYNKKLKEDREEEIRKYYEKYKQYGGDGNKDENGDYIFPFEVENKKEEDLPQDITTNNTSDSKTNKENQQQPANQTPINQNQENTNQNQVKQKGNTDKNEKKVQFQTEVKEKAELEDKQFLQDITTNNTSDSKTNNQQQQNNKTPINQNQVNKKQQTNKKPVSNAKWVFQQPKFIDKKKNRNDYYVDILNKLLNKSKMLKFNVQDAFKDTGINDVIVENYYEEISRLQVSITKFINTHLFRQIHRVKVFFQDENTLLSIEEFKMENNILNNKEEDSSSSNYWRNNYNQRSNFYHQEDQTKVNGNVRYPSFEVHISLSLAHGLDLNTINQLTCYKKSEDIVTSIDDLFFDENPFKKIVYYDESMKSKALSLDTSTTKKEDDAKKKDKGKGIDDYNNNNNNNNNNNIFNDNSDHSYDSYYVGGGNEVNMMDWLSQGQMIQTLKNKWYELFPKPIPSENINSNSSFPEAKQKQEEEENSIPKSFPEEKQKQDEQKQKPILLENVNSNSFPEEEEEQKQKEEEEKVIMTNNTISVLPVGVRNGGKFARKNHTLKKKMT